MYRVAQKWHSFWYTLTSSNINRFSQLLVHRFHCQNQEKCVIRLSLKISPHLKCVATLPCEMSRVLTATIENKTTSVTTHFKEINNREQRVYCLSYCLKYKVNHMLQFLHQMFNLFALQRGDPLKLATLLTNSAIDETLQ